MRLKLMTVSLKSLLILPVAMTLLVGGCKTATEDNDTTNTFVTVSESSSDIFADVCTGSGDSPPTCSVVNDNAEVVMLAQPKDLGGFQSTVQDIVFTRYRVTYIRADGRNVAGVDVPHPFDGVANFRVPVDGTTTTRGFMIVRHQAKLESPLAELQTLGGAQVLSVIARVDFFGQDLAGRQLQVSAFYNISFADFPG